MDFIPDKTKLQPQGVPYFEDSKSADVAGRRTDKSVSVLQKEVAGELVKLGAYGVEFVPGEFPVTPKRYGFRITFTVNGIPARLDVAALPLRSPAPRKKEQALAQCLYLVRDWLKAQTNAKYYQLGVIPLLPYLIGAGGKTIAEALIESGQLPQFAGYLPERTQ